MDLEMACKISDLYWSARSVQSKLVELDRLIAALNSHDLQEIKIEFNPGGVPTFDGSVVVAIHREGTDMNDYVRHNITTYLGHCFDQAGFRKVLCQVCSQLRADLQKALDEEVKKIANQQ